MAPKVDIYGIGMVCLSVCAPKEMTREEVEVDVNAQHPSGVGPWQIADEPFADGTENPHPCEKEPEHKQHFLLHC